MTGCALDPEEVGQRGQPDPAQATFEQAPGERGRAERRLGQAPPVQDLQLPLQEALVEAGVVGDEQGIAREGEEAIDDARHRRCTPELLLAQPGQAGYGLGKGYSRINERLKGVDELERPHTHGAELADPAPRQ